MQAADAVLEQEHVVDELIQATGQYAGLILEQGEVVHLLDRLAGAQPGGSPMVMPPSSRLSSESIFTFIPSLLMETSKPGVIQKRELLLTSTS